LDQQGFHFAANRAPKPRKAGAIFGLIRQIRMLGGLPKVKCLEYTFLPRRRPANSSNEPPALASSATPLLTAPRPTRHTPLPKQRGLGIGMASAIRDDDVVMPNRHDDITVKYCMRNGHGEAAALSIPQPLSGDVSFHARVSVKTHEADSAREFNALIEFMPSRDFGRNAGAMALRKTFKGKDGLRSVSKHAQYFELFRCLHVTSLGMVSSQNTFSVHFAKLNEENASTAVPRRCTYGRDPHERTKVDMLTFRGWDKVSVPAVERLWTYLDNAIAERKKLGYGEAMLPIGKTPAPALFSSRMRARAPPSTIDQALRIAERNHTPQFLVDAERRSEAKPRSTERNRGRPQNLPGADNQTNSVKAFQAPLVVKPFATKRRSYSKLHSLSAGLIGRPQECNLPLYSSKVTNMEGRSCLVGQKMRTRTSKKVPVDAPVLEMSISCQPIGKHGADPVPDSNNRLSTSREEPQIGMKRPGYLQKSLPPKILPLNEESPPTKRSRGNRQGTPKNRVTQISQGNGSSPQGDKQMFLDLQNSRSDTAAASPGDVLENTLALGLNSKSTLSDTKPTDQRLSGVARPRSRSQSQLLIRGTEVATGDSPVRSGILNLGNTCYLGAALQALLSHRAFVSDISKCCSVTSLDAAPFAFALVAMDESRFAASSSLSGALVSVAASPLTPELVVRAISAHFKEFGSAAQQDVQEFITRCFFVLERELGQTIFRCPVSRNFSIVIESTSSCLTCGMGTKPRNELLRDLSLDMPSITMISKSCDSAEIRKPPSLSDLLRNYFQSQEVDLTCENKDCSGLRAATRSRVALLPRILVLHLKRFRVESDNAGRFSLKKVSDPVAIPEFLDLGLVRASSAPGPSIFEDMLYDEVGATCSRAKQASTLESRSHTYLHPNVVGRTRVGLPKPKLYSERREEAKVLTFADCSEIETDELKRPMSSQGSGNLSPRNVAVEKEIEDASDSQGTAEGRCHRQNTGRVYKTFCEAAEFYHVEDAHSNLDTVAHGQRVMHSLGTQQILEDVDDVEQFEPSQAHHVVRQNERDEAAIQELCRELDVSEEDARSALLEVNFDITRASGLLLDKGRKTAGRHVEADKIRVSSVLELVERHLKSSRGVSPETKRQYQLSAIIRHCSDFAECGHYTCDIRLSDKSWACYNDESVEVHDSSLSQQADRQRDGYMFFYHLQG
jgi:ubiquitin C-terminal hydrolase